MVRSQSGSWVRTAPQTKETLSLRHRFEFAGQVFDLVLVLVLVVQVLRHNEEESERQPIREQRSHALVFWEGLAITLTTPTDLLSLSLQRLEGSGGHFQLLIQHPCFAAGQRSQQRDIQSHMKFVQRVINSLEVQACVCVCLCVCVRVPFKLGSSHLSPFQLVLHHGQFTIHLSNHRAAAVCQHVGSNNNNNNR